MSKTSTVPVRTADDILVELRAQVGEVADAIQVVNRITPMLFANSHQWARMKVEQGEIRSMNDACLRLAKALKLGRARVESWVYCGAFMAKHRMNPKKVDAAAVRLLFNSFGKISKAEQLDLVSSVKRGCQSSRVRQAINSSKVYGRKEAVRRAAKLERSGNLTEAQIKMQAMALHTAAKKLYPDQTVHVDVTVYSKKGGKKDLQIQLGRRK